jgi:hypothetical protein
MTKQIEKLLKDSTPFCVIQYFEFLLCGKDETYKKYELMFINSKIKVAFRSLEKDEIEFIKSHTELIKIVLDNHLGKVWEFMDFKEFKNQKVK